MFLLAYEHLDRRLTAQARVRTLYSGLYSRYQARACPCELGKYSRLTARAWVRTLAFITIMFTLNERWPGYVLEPVPWRLFLLNSYILNELVTLLNTIIRNTI